MILFGKRIGKYLPPFIVAEISCNHSGSLDQAKQLIKAAKDATADAVKIQVYSPDDMTWMGYKNEKPPEDFQIKNGPWAGNSLQTLYRKTQTPYEWVPELFDYAKSIDIPIFASVFSLKGLFLLEELKCEVYKIASFELVDLPLIRKVAKTNKTVILSCGMASLDEIDQAMQCVNPDNSILMHCVSSYPCPNTRANLWNIERLKNFYRGPIGYSDHTVGAYTAQIAVGAGACVFEKHLSISKEPTEDTEFSIDLAQFKRYAEIIRDSNSCMQKSEVPGELASKQFRRSLYVVQDIQKGEAFTPSNVRSIRPSYGLPPSMYSTVIISKASCDIKAGTALKKEYLI